MNPESAPKESAPKWLRLKRKGYPTIVRENKPGSKFTCRIRFKGSVHFITLAETADKSFSAALEARREIHEGRWAAYKAATALRGYSTVGELLTAYDAGIHGVNDRIEANTVRNNISTFKNFLAWSEGQPENYDSTRVLLNAALSAETVAKFKTAYIAVAGDNRELREQRRRGADAVLRQVRSLFTGPALMLYKKIHLPDLKEFLGAARVVADPRIHRTITDEILRAMHNEMELLRQQQSPLWVIHALHKYAGLRTDEVVQVRAEWFSRAPWGQVFLSVLTRPYFEPKQSQGHIPLSREVAAQIAPYVTGKVGSAHIITATSDYQRTRLVERTHAAWMRKFLPADQYAKAGYELRRWSAQVMRTHYGEGAAQAFLRHATQTVAGRHYFEHFYPWQTHGNDIGIRINDATGSQPTNVLQTWREGADALSGLEITPEATVVSAENHP